MALQNRTNRTVRDSEAKVLYFARLSRGFKWRRHVNSPAYNSFPSPVDEEQVRIQLEPNALEKQYEQARIEYEGPDSKKWPGANWMEESEAGRDVTEAIGPARSGGRFRSNAEYKACAKGDVEFDPT